MNTDNRIIAESYEKQINSSATYDYHYYAPQQYSPSTTDTSSFYSVSTSRKGSLQQHHQLRKQQSSSSLQKVYPLTLENVSRVQAADPSNMPLARYCSEMEERAGTPEPSYRRPSSTSTKKTLRRVLQQEDTVLESPRLLPFPYHNDSYFLPTAEHDYPGGCSVVTDASSSVANLSLYTFGSRQNLSINYSISGTNSLYHPNQQRCGYQRQLLSSPASKSSLYSAKRFNIINDDDTMSNYSNKRRAASVTPLSPSTLHENSEVPQKKIRGRSSNNKFALVFKQNLLRFKSNSPILECHNNNVSSGTTNPQFHLSTISSANSAASNNLGSTPTNGTAKVINKHQDSIYTKKAAGSRNKNNGTSSSWFDRLRKFIKSSPFVKSNNGDDIATTISTPVAVATDPVWYSQFRCNPPPPPGMTLLS